MTDTKIFLADTSAWLEYFLNPGCEAAAYIDTPDTMIITSVISLHEARKKLIKLKKQEHEISDAIDFIKANSVILPVTQAIAEKSVSDCIAHNLHTVDSMIYRTAVESGAMLITYDMDFKDMKNVSVLKK